MQISFQCRINKLGQTNEVSNPYERFLLEKVQRDLNVDQIRQFTIACA